MNKTSYMTGISSKASTVSLSPKRRGLPSLFGTSNMTVRTAVINGYPKSGVATNLSGITETVVPVVYRDDFSAHSCNQSPRVSLLEKMADLSAFFERLHNTKASPLVTVAVCVSLVPSFNIILPTGSRIFIFSFHFTLRAERVFQ